MRERAGTGRAASVQARVCAKGHVTRKKNARMLAGACLHWLGFIPSMSSADDKVEEMMINVNEITDYAEVISKLVRAAQTARTGMDMMIQENKRNVDIIARLITERDTHLPRLTANDIKDYADVISKLLTAETTANVSMDMMIQENHRSVDIIARLITERDSALQKLQTLEESQAGGGLLEKISRKLDDLEAGVLEEMSRKIDDLWDESKKRRT